MVPVNPRLSEVLGEKAYPSLSEAAKAEQIDIVDVFRRPDAVPAIVDEVLALGIPALWLQETVVHEDGRREGAGRGRVRGDGQVHPERAPETRPLSCDSSFPADIRWERRELA